MMAGLPAHAGWTVSNALDVPADLAKVSIFDVFTQATGAPGTLTLIPDPTGTLKNPDGSPAIVVEARGSQTAGARLVQSYNFPAPAPTTGVYTFYFRWMYPTGGAVSWQELAPYSGESEIGQGIKRGNGIWFHNWWDLAFAYNGGGTWKVGSTAGKFSAGTWYEYWLVVDPANVSFDWYIRGGTQWPEISPVFLDGLFVNLDLTLPLKALQEVHVMGQEGFYGPQYYDAMFIDTTGVNLTTPPGLGSIFGGSSESRSKLVNISTRGPVGTGSNILIGGFVITGDSPQKVLVRASGETLGGLGVSNVLEDTVLKLFNAGGTLLAENNNWGDASNAAEISAAAVAVGAFAFGVGSKDSALLITLDPGAYTVQVSGNGVTTGNAIVEVYKSLLSPEQHPHPAPAPRAPAGLVARAGDGGVWLDWRENLENDVAGYLVYRAPAGSGAFEPASDSLASTNRYLDTAARRGADYDYRITAVDGYGRESGPSATITVQTGYALFAAPASIVADPRRNRLFIAGHEFRNVAEVDPESGAILTTVWLTARPTGLAMSGDGGILFVTAADRGGDGTLYRIDPDTGALVGSTAAGHWPVAPMVDGDRLFICDRYVSRIRVHDLAGRPLAELEHPALREPVGLAVAQGRLYAAGSLPVGRATELLNAAAIAVFNRQTLQPVGFVSFPDGVTCVQDIRASADGTRLFVPHIYARHRVPATQVEQGWMNNNAVSVVSTSTLSVAGIWLLDSHIRGAANPWAVAVDGANLYCVTAGTHELHVIDVAAATAAASGSDAVSQLHKPYAHQPIPRGSPTLRYSLAPGTRLDSLRAATRRIQLPVNGPRSIALLGGRAFIPGYFSDSLAVVTGLTAPATATVSAYPLTVWPVMSQARHGERLFHDAVNGFLQGHSCASCHPGGRADPLNWDLLNDGMGNPKQVKSLLYSPQTPPAMSLGVRANSWIAVEAGFLHDMFAVVPREDLDAVHDFIGGMRPLRGPALVDGGLSPAALRGRIIFMESCIACHSGPYFTDGRSHDLGTGTGPDAGKAFDTPTLIEIWRTAPYFHDGRHATLAEALSAHPRATGLTEGQRADLVEYLRSIDSETN